MLEATQLRNGITFLYAGKPYKVIQYSHIKMGRGGAIVRVLARNLESGAIETKTLSSNIKIEAISTQKRKLQYLYRNDKTAFFIDPKTFEQVEVPLKVIEDELPFIKEQELVNVFFWEDKPLSIEIPARVVLEVVEAPPAVRGDSATNVFKTAVLENGLSLKVPLFISKGDRVVVDTRTKEYVERAKQKA